MTNKQKYDKVFIDTFSIEENALKRDIAYNAIPAWDSVGHMAMVAGVEDAFGIQLETDDIVNFSSYKKGMELLKKYGIKL